MTAQQKDGSARVDVRFWGTRGSIPSPGPETVVYGGNTSCVEVLWNGMRVILDGGTGIRSLGTVMALEDDRSEDLSSRELDGSRSSSVPPPSSAHPSSSVSPSSSVHPSKSAIILLSHYHWDHVQGLPFFSPLYDADSRLTIVGPAGSGSGVRALMDTLLDSSHFPVPRSHLRANLGFVDVPQGGLDVVDLGDPATPGPSSHLALDGVPLISAFPCRHGLETVAYRLDLGGFRLCYAPDNELVGGEHECSAEWASGFRSFVAEADVLIHDAMFTDQEYPRVEGWGHSTYRQATDLALESGVRRLVYFHHAPDRSDSAVAAQVEVERRYLAGAPDTVLEVTAAREGEKMSFVAPIRR